jgi:hypothetical protein
MTYDPNTPNSKYFGKHANGKLAQELFKDNRPEYERRRLLAEQDGLISPRPVWADVNYRKRFDPPQPSEETLRLLADAELSADAVKYYGGGPSNGSKDTVSKLAQENPEHYKRVRACAIAKGFIEDRPAQPVPEPKPQSQFFRLSDEVADQAGLPHGHMCNADGFEKVLKVIEEVRDQKRKAEELAAKTTAQLERDAAVDKSVAKFGRLLDLNREISTKQRERDAEVPIA